MQEDETMDKALAKERLRKELDRERHLLGQSMK